MKFKHFYLFALGCMLFACTPKTTNDLSIIEKQEVQIEDGKLTPEILWAMGRVSQVTLSPDKQTLLFAITYYDVEENRGASDLYTMDVKEKKISRLTKTSTSEFCPTWHPDGKRIGFISRVDQRAQIFEIDLNGGSKKQISDIADGALEGFSYAPDGKKIMYIKTVEKKDQFAYLKKDLPKTTGRINDDLAYRHWDEWVDAVPQVFIADIEKGKLVNHINLLEGTEFESPLRPWGGVEQISWSPNSENIAYTCRKKTGKEYALSTNSDIYLYNLASKETKNLSEGMMGYDLNPVFSPNGKFLAWESMARDGYEADKTRLILCDLSTGEWNDVSKNFDQNIHLPVWSADNENIYFVSNRHGVDNIYEFSVSSLSFRQITEGVHSYTQVFVGDNQLIGTKMSMSLPTEIFAVNLSNGSEEQLSFVNKEILDQLSMANIEERWFKATDGKNLHSWVIYPPDFDSTKKYPTLLYCQGGPQSTVSQFWSYRWNFQIMAANGYIVVAPNRRGLPGFGQEWNEQISGDYGGQCMKDYLTAIDEMAKMPYVDETRLGAVGASFGGYSVFWLAGNHEKRFSCFIAHNGMFNLEQQYLETEEMFFVNWDLGGPFWDKSNKTAMRSYANSPHLFVDKWNTPLMVIHSEYDYRIVASQGMAAYNAALLKGVPARYLYFPDETHWVLRPQNSILWQRNFFDWLDMWLKK